MASKAVSRDAMFTRLLLLWVLCVVKVRWLPLECVTIEVARARICERVVCSLLAFPASDRYRSVY